MFLSASKRKNTSLYQAESLLLLASSQRFHKRVLKLHIKHYEKLHHIKDFDDPSEDAGKFKKDIKSLLKEYKLPHNFMTPVGNYIKTLDRNLLLETPPFFYLQEIDSDLGKQVIVVFFDSPTGKELTALGREVQKAFKASVIPKKKSTEAFRRNLFAYVAHKKQLNPSRFDMDQLLNVLYPEGPGSIGTLEGADKKRKNRIRKGISEVKKEFERRFGQPIDDKIRFNQDGSMNKKDRFDNRETVDLIVKE